MELSFAQLDPQERVEAIVAYRDGDAIDLTRQRKRSGRGRSGTRSAGVRQLLQIRKAIKRCGPEAKLLVDMFDVQQWDPKGSDQPSVLTRLDNILSASIAAADVDRGRPPELRYQDAVIALARAWKKRSGGELKVGSHANEPTTRSISPLVDFVASSLLAIERLERGREAINRKGGPRAADPHLLKNISAARAKARSALIALRKSGQI